MYVGSQKYSVLNRVDRSRGLFVIQRPNSFSTHWDPCARGKMWAASSACHSGFLYPDTAHWPSRLRTAVMNAASRDSVDRGFISSYIQSSLNMPCNTLPHLRYCRRKKWSDMSCLHLPITFFLVKISCLARVQLHNSNGISPSQKSLKNWSNPSPWHCKVNNPLRTDRQMNPETSCIEIDHNFSKAHRVITTSIIPVVKKYAEHSKEVWEGSKVVFFPALVNPSHV